ncbi:MAG: thioesterase family protein [SAR324 cluster bacterium]|jgi:acyl-CoA thioester hydrolase|nr:thioesterase family protein [SAR324 cluster bacterium]MDP6744668.1 thioesterase family protein [SAR324 cluster bacterium]MDP7614483.1 thioesterase family protein [SAR324 cluster bacterium]MED5402531.1 thioesterase family protein [SAR324 cluster bacterium]|tara:strand:- start:544 stop:978 length:435 start_codon:yes stop_codon:yes gene_type:complete
MQELLKSFPVVVEIPVIWGDMDSFQHVNNVIYFRYFESARIQYFEAVGLMDIVEQLGVGPILGSTSCRYRTPLTYPDTVYVGAKITEMHEKRFTMEYLIVSEQHPETVAEGSGVVICYNYQKNQSTQIPEVVHHAIEKLEGREF